MIFSLAIYRRPWNILSPATVWPIEKVIMQSANFHYPAAKMSMRHCTPRITNAYVWCFVEGLDSREGTLT